VLLDEPFSNLDSAIRDHVRSELRTILRNANTSAIIVTHDQHEALALADRVAVMNKGVIEQLDAPETLYHSPQTPFVASFVGGANLLDGRVAGRTFVSNGHTFALPEALTHPDGPATLAVRPESFELGSAVGPALPIAARLFLGSSLEYRLTFGDAVLRVVSPRPEFQPGASVTVSIQKAHLYAP
jgi:iron(III) transport system ATP-binding protein